MGRLTFTSELAGAIAHLLGSGAPYGTYNLTNAGPAMTWADIAVQVFLARGRPAAGVRRVSTQTYGEGRSLAPRPQHSMLALDKITAAGFSPRDGGQQLAEYLASLD